MIFDHMVKFNGVYYNAGEDVPMGASSKVTETVETPKEKEVTIEEIAVEDKPKKTKKVTKA